MSRSSTIANCCGVFQSRPRWYRVRVICWNSWLPFEVNARRTTGWPNWSKSACVPDDFSSPPVISGMRLFSSGFVGSYLKR